MKKKNTIFTNNNDLYETNQSVKDYVKSHRRKLNETEKNTLGNLLDERAKAISNFLGVKVSSIVNKKEK